MPAPWSLRYPGVDMLFTDASGIFMSKFPEVSSPEIQTQDVGTVRGNTDLMGVDTAGGRTLGMGFGITGSTEDEMLDRFGVLEAAWDAESVRSVAGSLAELRSGRGRAAIGRPRRIAMGQVEPYAQYMQADADFVTIDRYWYGDQQQASAALVPAPGGGFSTPFRFPISTTATSSRSTTFTVGGAARTWPVITIAGGPITNPDVEVPGLFRFRPTVNLTYDQPLVIDTRPWARSVRRAGASVGGVLGSQSTRLSDAALRPGTYQLILRGMSTTGTPTATITWRTAHTTP